MHSPSQFEVIALTIIFCFVCMLMAFAVWILFLYQKHRKKFFLDLEAARINYERETFKAQLEMQEETFKNISREIHDNVGQILSLAKLHLNTLDLDQRELAIEKVEESTGLLTKALNDLRNISRNLNSDLIHSGGFEKAVEQQVIQLQKTGRYHVLFEAQGDNSNLADKKSVFLFRILQEAINNIVKHSSANEIIILLCYEVDRLTLRIQDNGNGFDLPNLERSNPAVFGGLHNMKKRASLVDAAFNIESNPGKGTKITVTAPV